jgi:membrane-associated phospholipid phosphatase
LTGEALSVDERLLRVARTCGHNPARERAVARFSRIGEHGMVWLAIGCAGQALAPARRSGWRAATAKVACAYALNTAIKLLVRRRRPQLEGLPPLAPTPTALSFPSAHASTSFAGAVSFAAMGVPPLPLGALAIGLSLSRLYLGLHYPSDVVAGAVLGGAIGSRGVRR